MRRHVAVLFALAAIAFALLVSPAVAVAQDGAQEDAEQIVGYVILGEEIAGPYLIQVRFRHPLRARREAVHTRAEFAVRPGFLPGSTGTRKRRHLGDRCRGGVRTWIRRYRAFSPGQSSNTRCDGGQLGHHTFLARIACIRQWCFLVVVFVEKSAPGPTFL